MLTISKGQIKPEDLDIILSDDLIDEAGNWYNLTFRMALEEQKHGSELIWCEYEVETLPDGTKRLLEFIGWTEDRVIYDLVGVGVQDTLLGSVPRNPPNQR